MHQSLNIAITHCVFPLFHRCLLLLLVFAALVESIVQLKRRLRYNCGPRCEGRYVFISKSCAIVWGEWGRAGKRERKGLTKGVAVNNNQYMQRP